MNAFTMSYLYKQVTIVVDSATILTDCISNRSCEIIPLIPLFSRKRFFRNKKSSAGAEIE